LSVKKTAPKGGIMVKYMVRSNLKKVPPIFASKNENGKRYSLKQILEDDPEWLKAVSTQIWGRIRSSPSWKQVVDLNGRLIALEGKVEKANSKLDELLIFANNGGNNQ